MKKVKLVRITTVPISLRLLLKGQLREMNKHFDVIAISSPGDDLNKFELEEHVKTIPIKMERRPSMYQDIISLLKMIQIIRAISPQIVHTHTPKAGFIGMVASRIVGVKVRLHTVAGIPWIGEKGIRRFVLWLIEYLTYSVSTHVYCNSFHLMNFIINNKLIKPTKISVLGNGSSNGIDTDYYKLSNEVEVEAQLLRAKFGLTDEKVILFVGRKVKDKGVEELVKAFLVLKGKHNIKLLLVGPLEHNLDPLSDYISEVIKNDSSIINVEFVEDVRPYMAISYLLAFPSHREGFPNVPIQACSIGLPCVVSDINGCNEIIISEFNGLIFPVKDEKALAKSIEMLLNDINLRNKLGSNGRDLMRQNYDQKKIWGELIKEYNSYMN